MLTVSVSKCEDYNYENVYKTIHETFENIGGLEKYIKPGMKVLIKVNLLMARKPETATTTHPSLIKAVIQKIHEAKAFAIIADSPGGPYSVSMLRNVYRKCGIEDIAKETGALLNYNLSSKTVSFDDGKVAKAFEVITPVLDADVIINMPKLKTHEMTFFTGGVKNLFGVIPGIHKAEYHFRMSDKKVFSDLLIDLCECINPTLTIMDGIIGMEGSGPSAGNPRKIGIVLASESSYNLDLVASQIIGLKKTEVHTIQNSINRGLCVSNIDDLNIVGCDLKEIIINNFKRPQGRSVAFLDNFPSLIKRPLEAFVSPKPLFVHDKCVGCKICEKNCPAKIIHMDNNKPFIELNKCIKCFCCHELCPEKAVEIKRPWPMRFIIKRS